MKNENQENRYLCPYCSTELGTYDDLKSHVVAEHGDEPVPLPAGFVRLTINGRDYQEKVEPEWTLYYLIHDKLGLIGAKQFCDRGVCGSCTVIVDGRPMLSCMMLAIECHGQTIETVEGIADAEHPLIESYVKHHAMQCGYCTPGFVVTSKALLDRKAEPSLEEIRQALAGNLCRCGTYPQHPTAVQEAAQVLKAGPVKKKKRDAGPAAEKMDLADVAREAAKQLQEGGADG